MPESERRGGAAVHVQDVGDWEGRGRRQRAKRDDEDGGVPGKTAVVPLVVHRKMLHGASTEIHLSVRIDEVRI